MPQRDTIVRLIIEVVADISGTNIGDLAESTRLLDEVGLDSLACAELIERVRASCDLSFETSTALRFDVLTTVASLGDFLTAQSSSRSNTLD
mgnify:CR=1 FL=1